MAMQTRIWSARHSDDQPAKIASITGYEYHVFAPAIRSKAFSRLKEEHDHVSDTDISGVWKDGCTECDGDGSSYDGRCDGRFGIAILSKHPIVQINTHQYQRYKRKTIRNAMACLISLPNNTQVWIVNTHLGCHFIGKEQNQQAKELVVFINSLDQSPTIAGVIVCGDTNSPPLFASIRTLKQSGLVDVWPSCTTGRIQRMIGGGSFPSYAGIMSIPLPCFRKLLRLDYIFVREANERRIFVKYIYVQDDGLDCSLASDHLPLCMVFFLKCVSGAWII